MKASLLTLVTLVSLTATVSHAKHTACRTDGCVAEKNAQAAAALAYVEAGPNGDDGCMTNESYLFSFERLSDSTFKSVCGDVDSKTTTVFRVKKSSGGYEVEVLSVK